MFKSIKNKIVSFLIIVGALTQTGKADQPVEQRIVPQSQPVVMSEEKAMDKTPTQSQGNTFPVGGAIGLAAVGLLTVAGIKGTHSFEDVMNFRDELDDLLPEGPMTRPVKPQQKMAVQPSAPQVSEAAPAFDPMAVRVIARDENMTQEERKLLATRLRAVRQMEDIRRERAKLTRQMAKAKNEHDNDKIDAIRGQRSALTTLRKVAFAEAVGPVYAQVKEERRLLAKQMRVARRRKDEAAQAEIIKRREQLKLIEQLAVQTVRDFKYSQERTKFVRRKPVVAQPAVAAVIGKVRQHTLAA